MSISIRLETEQDVWDTLAGVLAGEIDPKEVTLDFRPADWARLKLKFDGKPFHQSLTAPVMAGLVDFQNALYKSLALVTKGDARVNRLQDIEKSQFELIFEVRDGSSEIEAAGKDGLVRLATTMAERMTGKQMLAAILLVAAMYFGTQGLSAYLDHQAKIAKEESARETIKDVIRGQQEIIKLLNDVKKGSDAASKVLDQSFDAYESIIRKSWSAETLEIQGHEFSASQIAALTKGTRRTAKDVTLTKLAKVLSVDSTDPRGFIVRLELQESGDVVSAEIFDTMVLDKYRKVIQSSEWGKSPIMVRISGRMIGDAIVDGKIIKAWRPRKRSS